MSQGGGGYGSPVTSRNDPPQEGFILYDTDQSQWAFVLGAGSGWKAAIGPNVELNVWVHLAGTYDVATQTDAALRERPGDSKHSRRYLSAQQRPPLADRGGWDGRSGAYFFNGKVAEVRLWDRRVPRWKSRPRCYAASKGNEAGLKGYWPLNEGSGMTATDRSGNGHDGALQGNPTWVEASPRLASPRRAKRRVYPSPPRWRWMGRMCGGPGRGCDTWRCIYPGSLGLFPPLIT